MNLTTEFGYDNVGNANSITDPRGNETTFSFDDERRLVQKTEAAPFSFVSTWEYDDNGMKIAFSRQTGDTANPLQIWQWVYLANGMTQEILDPSGNATRFAYDTLGRLVAKTDAELRRYQL